jgi:hypothetical protein
MLVLRRTGVVAVAITLGDSAIPIVDNQLGALVAADLPSPVNGVLLPVEVTRSSAAAAPFDVPPAAFIRDDVMRFPAQGYHPLRRGPFYLTT